MKSKPKSCVIVVENLPLPLDRRVWQEARALREDGWDVAVICPSTDRFPEAYEELEGVHIYRHPLPVEASGKLGFLLEYGAALFHEARLLATVYFRHGFRIIQACNPPDLIFLVAAPFKLLGVKLVFDHHDICPELFGVKFGRKGLLHKALLFFEKLTYLTADHVITANDAFRDLAAARTGKRKEDITAVYSIPNTENMRRIQPRSDLHEGKRLILGYMGIIGNQDGVDHLVRAVAHLKQRGINDIRTVVIGDGTDLEAVKRLAAELGVTDDITFTGYLTGQELLSTLSALDIGVIPDPYNEYNDKISMNKVFEYSKLGLPIVSYPLSETTRLLEDAVQVAPGREPDSLADAIAALLNDTHRQVMAEKARALSERKFSWENEKQKYLAVFNRLAGTAHA